MECFSDIIDAWPKPSPVTFAADIGEEVPTVRQMRLRDSLPAGYWRRAVKAARRRRIRGVTLDRLALIAERVASRKAAA